MSALGNGYWMQLFENNSAEIVQPVRLAHVCRIITG
jgi:hypothetical protein